MTCYRYIELNPVRARMVAAPGDYPWSSYRTNASGMANPLVTPHELYLSLGPDDEARRVAYRELFSQALDASAVEELRQATNGGWAIGSNSFKAQIAALAARRAVPRPKGRKAADGRLM